MCPITHESFLGLGAAVISSFIFGFLWYGMVFGKTWAALMGKKVEDCKDMKPKPSSLLLNLLGTFLTTFALAYMINHAKFYCIFGLAFLVWLGFYVPLLSMAVIWEGRPWKLFALNAAFYLLNLQLITLVLISF